MFETFYEKVMMKHFPADYFELSFNLLMCLPIAWVISDQYSLNALVLRTFQAVPKVTFGNGTS